MNANGAASIEAMDDFLARFAAQRPGLPERTATPVMRLHTPNVETISHSPGATVNGGGGATLPLYSSRPNSSMAPLPAGSGRVLSAGSLQGSGRPRLSRQNSFTGKSVPAEGVLSQMSHPGPPPPGSLRTASPNPSRPPMLPHGRISGAGSASGIGVFAHSRDGPGSRPGSGFAAGTLRPGRLASHDGGGDARSPTAGSGSGRPRLSRSRSLTAGAVADSTDSLPGAPSGPQRGASLSILPPQDSLDVAMKSGLGSRPSSGLAAGLGGGHGSPGGTAGGPHMAPIPRSPLSGRLSRGGSAGGAAVVGVARPDSSSSSSHLRH